MSDEKPWWERDPTPGERAEVDQIAAAASRASMSLVALYISYCDGVHNGKELEAVISQLTFTKHVQELLPTDHETAIPVIAHLCHVIYGMALKRHGDDWAAMYAAVERGELFFDGEDDPENVMVQDLEKLVSEPE